MLVYVGVVVGASVVIVGAVAIVLCCGVLCCVVLRSCFVVACWCRNPFKSGSKSTKNRSKIEQIGARGDPQEVKKRENQKESGGP